MIICTAIFAWVLKKSEIIWEGAGAAWLLAAFCDFSLMLAYLILKYKPDSF